MSMSPQAPSGKAKLLESVVPILPLALLETTSKNNKQAQILLEM